MDKGKFKDAVAFFEKAYRSSPDNKTIAQDLVYAYSRYGSVLAESEDYDRSIEYLKKAYDILPDQFVTVESPDIVIL